MSNVLNDAGITLAYSGLLTRTEQSTNLNSFSRSIKSFSRCFSTTTWLCRWKQSKGQLTNQKSWEKATGRRAQRCDFCSVSLLPFLPPHPEASMVMLNCLNRETLFFCPFHSSVPLFASSQPFALFQPLSPTSQPITPPETFSLPPSRSWFLSLARPHPLCVTGLPFLIADPSLCYYSGPPLYNMFLFYGAYKGSI